MEIVFWGTAAAEGIPALFCACEVCRKAREEKTSRGRAQVMIDGKLLVDFNADTWSNSIRYGFDMSKLGHVLITHTHEDHFYPSELHNRQISFAYDMAYPALTFHGAGELYEAYHTVMRHGQYLLDQGRVALEPMTTYTPYEIEGYEVIALPATHGTYHPVVFMISDGKKRVLYGNDCGPFKAEVWEYLEKTKPHLDGVIYDCTMGGKDCLTDWGENASHGGLPDNMRERARLEKLGLTDKHTKHIITHFSHNGTGYSTDLFPNATAEGFLIAHDGLRLEI